MDCSGTQLVELADIDLKPISSALDNFEKETTKNLNNALPKYQKIVEKLQEQNLKSIEKLSQAVNQYCNLDDILIRKAQSKKKKPLSEDKKEQNRLSSQLLATTAKKNTKFDELTSKLSNAQSLLQGAVRSKLRHLCGYPTVQSQSKNPKIAKIATIRKKAASIVNNFSTSFKNIKTKYGLRIGLGYTGRYDLLIDKYSSEQMITELEKKESYIKDLNEQNIKSCIEEFKKAVEEARNAIKDQFKGDDLYRALVYLSSRISDYRYIYDSLNTGKEIEQKMLESIKPKAKVSISSSMT